MNLKEHFIFSLIFLALVFLSEEFAEQLLLRQHVAVVPGTAFGECGKGFIRASYATSVDNISEALARIKIS